MHQKRIQLLIIIIFLLLHPSLHSQSHALARIQSNPIMVVYIHGTNITPGLIKKWVGSEVKNDDIARIKEQVSPPTPTLGLKPIILDPNPQTMQSLPHKTTTFAHSFKLLAGLTDQLKNRTIYPYSFNWDGKLSKKSRALWAHNLYSDLVKEKEQLSLHAHGPVDVYIIAHSHGATVAAQLGTVEEQEKKNLSIAKLINLGAPILKETLSWLSSPIFQQVYHLYSPKDYVQVVGALSSKGIGISRELKATPSLPLPSNLTQIKVGIDATAPYHQEFWVTGTSPVFYRSSLSIYPLSIACFIPLILDIIGRFPVSPHQFSLICSRKNDRYFMKLFSCTNQLIALSSYPFNQTWREYLEKQIELSEPLTLAISKKVRNFLLLTGAVIGGSILINKLYSSDKETHDQQEQYP